MDLTPQVLKDVEFREKFRGYDPDEVDAFLEQVGTAIGQLQSRLKAALDQANSQAGQAAAPAEKAPSGPARLHDPEGALQRVLLAAQETADKVVYDAEVEATAMVSEAEQKSSALMAEADGHSEKVRAAAAAEARRALEEAREPLLAELADLRADRERLHGEVAALNRYLEGERADVVETIERLQGILSDPEALRMGEPPFGAAPDRGDEDPGGGGAVADAATPELATPEFAPPESSPAESAPPEPAPAPPLPAEGLAQPSAVPAEPDDPTPGARASGVVVDLTAEAQAAPAMAAQAPAEAARAPAEAARPPAAEEAPWSQGAEVIHGAFAAAEEDEPLDMVDPDGGPPTEAYLNLFNEGSGDTGDRFLSELRRAVDDEDDALGTPDEEADAAMAAFFDQDEDDPDPRR